jgi:hypothetical protein
VAITAFMPKLCPSFMKHGQNFLQSLGQAEHLRKNVLALAV